MFYRTIFVTFIFLLTWVQSSHAILFERRSRPDPELAYFLYPIIGSLPGVQDFYGAGFTVSSIGGSEMDITVISLRGEAEHFSGDFQLDLISILDVPLFSEHFTFSYLYGDIRNGALPEGERGIDSDPERIHILLAEEVIFQAGELSYNIFDKQFEIYFGYTDASVKPFGLIDPNGTFYGVEQAELRRQGDIYLGFI